MKKILLICVLAVLAKQNGYAQSVRLEDTVVTETNFETNIMDVSKNITIITKDEIAESGAKNLGEVLRRVPSLTVSTMGGADATFDLRGQGEPAKSNVLVLLDGTPLNTLDGSGYKTSQIDINSIAKIEVIPSGGSVLYGDGAVGGIINIITDSPSNRKNYGSVGVEAGSYDYSKIYGSYGTAITDDFLINGNFSSKNRNGYRDETKDDLDSFQITGKYLLTDGALSVGINHSKSKFSAPRSLEENDYNNNPTSTGGEVLSGKNRETIYHMNFNKKLTNELEVLVYANYREQEYRSLRAGTGWSQIINYDTEVSYIKPHLKYNYLSDAYIIAGMDYQYGKTKKESETENVNKESTGIFALNKFTTNNWEFTQGYRRQFIEYNYLKSDENYVMNRAKEKIKEDAIDLSANYKFNSSSSAYLSYTTAFRTPNTDEMTYNEPPKTQTSKTFEIGGKALYGNTFISTAIYKTLTQDEIYYNASTWENSNLEGENSRLGIEVALEHYFSSLTLRESFSYIKSEMKDGEYSGKEVPSVPNYLFNLGLTYDITSQLKFNGDLNYRGNSYSISDFSNRLSKNSSYVTLDINLQYSITENLNIYGGINNLTDKKYSENVVASGDGKRRVYYPGDRRNYYVGMKYNF